MGERFVLFFKKGNGTADSGSQRSVATEIWRLIPLKPVFYGVVPSPRASASPGNLLKMQIMGPALQISPVQTSRGLQVILMPAHFENHTNPYGLS